MIFLIPNRLQTVPRRAPYSCARFSLPHTTNRHSFHTRRPSPTQTDTSSQFSPLRIDPMPLLSEKKTAVGQIQFP